MKTLLKIIGKILLTPFYILVLLQILIGFACSIFAFLSELLEVILGLIDTARIKSKRIIRTTFPVFFPYEMPKCLRRINPKDRW